MNTPSYAKFFHPWKSQGKSGPSEKTEARKKERNRSVLIYSPYGTRHAFDTGKGLPFVGSVRELIKSGRV